MGNAPHWAMGVAEALLWIFYVLAFVYVLSGLDDLFVDAVAWLKRLRPRELGPQALAAMRALPEKRIAVIVPAWDESAIIARMLRGNLAAIQYADYHVFVGTYPNDPATADAVRGVALDDPRVHAVVNHKDGPTSKGQILNEVIAEALRWERVDGRRFDAFLMQDAEDIIHPLTLKLVNAELDRHDYVQVPVFSLDVSARRMVAGVYVDEFAEAHTKDMLVRARLGGCVPSAGVGTCLSRDLVLALREAQKGQVLREGCLTEDYELGVKAGLAGFRQTFAACYYRKEPGGPKEFIATREYFPKAFRRSVRQKTRWTLGIAIQGWRELGWPAGTAVRYFLCRDRKGLVTNVANVLGYVWLGLFVAWESLVSGPAGDVLVRQEVRVIGALTALQAANRLLQRAVCVRRVYGPKACLALLPRWPVGNLINSLAVLNAARQHLASVRGRKSVAWVKTDHELPDAFGQTASLGPPMTPGTVWPGRDTSGRRPTLGRDGAPRFARVTPVKGRRIPHHPPNARGNVGRGVPTLPGSSPDGKEYS